MRLRIALIAGIVLAGFLQPAGGQSLPASQPATPPAFRFCLLTGQGLEQTATQPATQPAEQAVFRFGVIADPHIEKIETAENLRRFLPAMRDEKIDFLIVLGDIVSYMRTCSSRLARSWAAAN